VSFDLLAQAFDQGSGPRRADILTWLRPFATQEDDEGFCRTRTADGGEADFYVGDGSFMVNHFSSGETLDLIVRTASANGLVLLGPELPVMVTTHASWRPFRMTPSPPSSIRSSWRTAPT
jgi:hypothetical protein